MLVANKDASIQASLLKTQILGYQKGPKANQNSNATMKDDDKIELRRDRRVSASAIHHHEEGECEEDDPTTAYRQMACLLASRFTADAAAAAGERGRKRGNSSATAGSESAGDAKKKRKQLPPLLPSLLVAQNVLDGQQFAAISRKAALLALDAADRREASTTFLQEPEAAGRRAAHRREEKDRGGNDNSPGVWFPCCTNCGGILQPGYGGTTVRLVSNNINKGSRKRKRRSKKMTTTMDRNDSSGIRINAAVEEAKEGTGKNGKQKEKVQKGPATLTRTQRRRACRLRLRRYLASANKATDIKVGRRNRGSCDVPLSNLAEFSSRSCSSSPAPCRRRCGSGHRNHLLLACGGCGCRHLVDSRTGNPNSTKAASAAESARPKAGRGQKPSAERVEQAKSGPRGDRKESPSKRSAELNEQDLDFIALDRPTGRKGPRGTARPSSSAPGGGARKRGRAEGSNRANLPVGAKEGQRKKKKKNANKLMDFLSSLNG